MAPSAGLSKVEREMVAVVVSAANDCLYCMTSHGYAVRVLLGDPVTAERILLDYHRAGLDARTLAMLDYAAKITQRPAACGLEDIECLHQHGFGTKISGTSPKLLRCITTRIVSLLLPRLVAEC